MDPYLARLTVADTPPLNPDLANGLAVKHFKGMEAYLDSIIRSAAKGFPPGLEYMGFRRCTPQESYQEITRRRNRVNKKVYDIAPSHLYMIRLHFRFNGVELPPRYLYLPFVGDAGSITISGSKFIISPVATDQVISKGISTIFVRLLRDRLTFERMPHGFIADDKRETVQVAWSTIYHKTAKMKKLRPLVQANCTLAHYLFCKYGVSQTFEKFAGCRPVIGTTDITPQNYPSDEWVICTTAGVRPKGVGRTFWEAPKVRIAIRREEYSPMVRSLLGGFFYVADHYPARILADYVDSDRLWKVIMGQILFSEAIHEGKLHDDVADHISSLDEYVDPAMAAELSELKDIKSPITDIYQLFATIIANFNEWILEGADKINSMYDKKLSVLYYVLYEITSAIYLLYFRLKAASKKVLTEKEITAAFNQTLKMGLIYGITRQHGEVSTISSSGDNKALRLTSMLVQQSGSSKNSNRKDRTAMSDPSKLFHPSIAEVCGYSNLPKSAPDGRSRLNLHVATDSRYVVQRNPEFIPLLDEIKQLTKR